MWVLQLLKDTAKNLIHENFLVYNIGIVYQDFQDILHDNLHSKHYFSVAG